ncbi:DUF3368 domain-containing protein [Candidatus Poribacteria bacterium]|nr:MAG: DUF3368 domain-containing protein [Candidatus Poribacteria bacterium]
MPIQPVISNTTPLIGLSGLNYLPLLRDLYTEVWIPREVEKEFLALDEIVYQEVLNSAPWIKVVDLTNPQSAAIYQGIDDGEAEVFALAVEHDARLVLLDENKGRKKGKEIGLTVKGTVGVLQEAKEVGLIDVIKPLLIQLQDNGIHLSESLINNALQDAGEAD